jgi:hypothetical protein
LIVRVNHLAGHGAYVIWCAAGDYIMPYKPYVPEGIGGVLDYLAHMLFASPTFKDKTGYLPRENIDTTLFH